MICWLKARAEETLSATALLHDEDRLDYRQLAAIVSGIAGSMREQGIAPGQRIGLLLGPNAVDNALCLHALWWQAVTVLPVGKHLPEHRRSVLHAAAALDGFLAVATKPGRPVESAEFPSGQPMTLMQTSGSSAAPRVIPLTPEHHRASVEAISDRLALASKDCWLCCLPLDHVGGLAILVRAVLTGAAVRLVNRFDAAEVAERIQHEPIDWVSLVPTQLRDLLEHHPAGFSTRLRGVLVGGAACPPELLAEARSRGLPVLPTWGMTEAGSQLSTPSPETAARIDFAACPGWVGSPLKGVQVRVDESGRLHARGPMMFNAERGMTELPWLSTSDRGVRLRDGDLRVLGRMDRTIISGGINVDLDALEAHLRRDAPVLDIALMPVDDPRWGQRIAAIVVPAIGVAPDRLEQWARSHLAPPERPMRWVATDEIPVSKTGKRSAEILHRMLLSKSDEAVQK